MTGGASAPWRTTDVWRWDPAKVTYARDIDGLTERVWLHPRTPSPAVRARLRLRVEIAYPFDRAASFDAGLRVLERQFRDDSWLAAIVRSSGSIRVVLYSDVAEATLHERCIVLRSVLRPDTISMLVVPDPEWAGLQALAIQTFPDRDRRR